MSHLLPLSRVAKLVGQSRHTLQAMIRSGELDTFDGMVDRDEAMRAFPDVKWDDDAEFRRVTAGAPACAAGGGPRSCWDRALSSRPGQSGRRDRSKTMDGSDKGVITW